MIGVLLFFLSKSLSLPGESPSLVWIENPLGTLGGVGQSMARVRLWWNWQTRYFEVVVGQPVQVQVLLSAPTPKETATLREG